MADPALEGADGLLAGLSLGLAAQVVGPSGSVVADLGDGDHVDGVIQGSVPSRVEAVADPRSARRLDGSGCVVGGELSTAAEPGGITDVADDEGGGDGADSVELGQRGARSGDGNGDTGLQPGDVTVEAADVAKVLACQTLAFQDDEVVDAHAAQNHPGTLGAEPHRRPAGHHLPEQHVESTHRLGPRRNQRLVAVGEHAHHRGVLVGGHRSQPAVAQPGDGGGEGVVGVVLGGLGRAEQPYPRRQRGWDVDDVLAGRNQLLGQQTSEAGGGLDRPGPLDAERLGPRQQPLGLAPVGGDGEPSDGVFVAVDGDGALRPGWTTPGIPGPALGA